MKRVPALQVVRARVARQVRHAFARPGDPPIGYSVYSEANRRRFEHWIWHPGGTEPLPVLLVLHGVNDASGFVWWQLGRAQETAAGLVRAGAVPPFLLVLATDGGYHYGSAYADWADGSVRMETHLVRELLPWVDSTFPTSGVRHVCGNSMGGHGAFVLALRNPGFVESVSALSAYFTPRTRLGADTADRSVAMYGDGPGLAAHDPHELAADRERVAGLRIAFDCGTQDWLLEDSRLFHRRLDELGVSHQYRELAGAHDWRYWRERFEAHVRFHLLGEAL